MAKAKKVRHTKITHRLADSKYSNIFNNINVNYYSQTDKNSDDTLRATANMLFHHRLKKDEGIEILITKASYSISANTVNILLSTGTEFTSKPVLSIMYYPDTYDEIKTLTTKALAELPTVSPDAPKYTINEVLSTYLTAMVVDGPQSTTILIPALSIRKEKGIEVFHRIVSAMFMYKIFNPIFEKTPATDEEIAMLKSLTEADDVWTNYADAWLKNADLERKLIMKMIAGFAKDPIEQRIQNLNQTIERIQNMISRLRDQLTTNIEDLETRQLEQAALVNRSQDMPDINESIAQFFISNKNVSLYEKRDGKLYYTVKSRLSLWDTDVVEAYINNPRSILYRSEYVRNVTDQYDYKVLKTFYEKWLVDLRYSLDVISMWGISSRAKAYPVSHWNFRSQQLEKCCPNPHLQEFSCIGRHDGMLADAEQALDYDGALLISVQSNSSINWNDSTVIQRFMAHLYSSAFNKDMFFDEETNTYKSISNILKEIENEFKEEA